MLPAERRQAILAEIRATDTVSAEALSRRFGVSVETIRRDLRGLHEQGLLTRVYGGATRPRAYEAPFETRRIEHQDRKRAMGRLAALLVEAGETLILDIGTSVAEVARAIPAAYRGKVLTNSLSVAFELDGRDGLEVLVSGGRLRPGDLALSGPEAVRFFSGYYADKAFLGSGGVHPEAGLTDYYPDEVSVRQVILDHAAESYVLADASKIGHIALCRVCSLEQVTGVITDSRIEPRWRDRLEEEGLTVLVAGTEEEEVAGTEEEEEAAAAG